MKIIQRLRHALFGHRFEIEDDTDFTWKERGALLQDYNSAADVRVEQKFWTFICQDCGETKQEAGLRDYRVVCECGAQFEIDHPMHAADKLSEHHSEHNHEKCEICEKLFVGEYAAQEKGGHKSSAHYG